MSGPEHPGRAALEGIITALQLRTDFPPEVLAEAEGFVKDPGTTDPALVDRTDTPFVTIDGPFSRDLDQALFVEKVSAGYLVEYAIADAAYYIKPGSALFAEAMKRGASYYFPGFSLPMLPRSLSEGVVSLNPGVDRRALLFRHRLSPTGELLDTELARVRIRSRAKLAFGQVQELIDHPDRSPLAQAPYVASLQALREVGRKRMAIAARRGLLRYRREEVEVKLDGQGMTFAVMELVHDEVEAWNEQISLLCNAEGGRLLHEHPSPAVQPIYRVQPGPEQARLDELARLTARIAALHGLPAERWAWNQATTSLADFLAQLPRAPRFSREDRVAQAVQRQGVMVNLRSEYSTQPAPHTGVGAEPYARFSAPMRELVGVFLHKEAIELLTGVHPPATEDEALRAEVVKVANRSRETQRLVQSMANEVVLDRLFAPELKKPRAERRAFRGTVMGVAGSKVHVRLDEPPLDVKLYLFNLAPFFGGAWLEAGDDGAVLRAKGTTQALLTVGAAVDLSVDRRDEKNRRWVFAPKAVAPA